VARAPPVDPSVRVARAVDREVELSSQRLPPPRVAVPVAVVVVALRRKK
jgi:hypothetical protein